MAGFRDNPYPNKPSRLRYIRSSLPFVIVLGTLAFFLSSLSLLSHYRSPASKQQVGWQSWDIVRVQKQNVTTGVDQTEADEEEDLGWPWDDLGVSYPLDNWDPLIPHTTGLTEIAVRACYMPPWIFPSYCAPPSTPEDDKAKGKWVIVEKDLDIRDGLWYLNIYYRRTRRLDVPLITDIYVAPNPLPETLKGDLEGWTLADGDLHSGVWPSRDELRLYYKTKEQSASATSSERQAFVNRDIITEVDVVYGDGEPFYGFERVQGEKIMQAKEKKWESVGLAVRRGSYSKSLRRAILIGADDLAPPRAEKPEFHADGTFKLMQIADLHFSIGKGECLQTNLNPCDGDEETQKWLATALDAEKPDLVVFSGDQLNGVKEGNYDSRAVLAKFARPVIDRQIPWAAIFGNHDSAVLDDREHQMRILMSMPYSLAQAGPKDVDGIGNYLIKIRSSDPSHIHLFTLYFLDSGDYQPRTFPWDELKYDYIKQTQIEWFKNASSLISSISRPFHPDGASDLDKIWSRRSRPARNLPESRAPTLAKPNAIMFFHMPLQEAYDEADVDADGEPMEMGVQLDWKGSSNVNSHLLDLGLLPMVAVEGDDGGVPEVKVTAHGHSHMTDRCRRVRGVWMCFDGGSSYTAYGDESFDRRVRIYQLSEWGERISTYKRLTTGETIDHQTLVEPISS